MSDFWEEVEWAPESRNVIEETVAVSPQSLMARRVLGFLMKYWWSRSWEPRNICSPLTSTTWNGEPGSSIRLKLGKESCTSGTIGIASLAGECRGIQGRESAFESCAPDAGSSIDDWDMHPTNVKRESIRRRYKSFFIKDGRQSKIKQERTVKNLNEGGWEACAHEFKILIKSVRRRCFFHEEGGIYRWKDCTVWRARFSSSCFIWTI